MNAMISTRQWTRHGRAPLLGALALAALLLAACNSNAGPPVASGVTAVSGSNQYAVVGTQAANPLVVLVNDDNGNPFGNAPVLWKVTAGGGTLADTVSTSNASGYATMTYTAGANPGAATVVAIVSGIWTASFTIYIESQSSRVVAQRAERTGAAR